DTSAARRAYVLGVSRHTHLCALVSTYNTAISLVSLHYVFLLCSCYLHLSYAFCLARNFLASYRSEFLDSSTSGPWSRLLLTHAIGRGVFIENSDSISCGVACRTGSSTAQERRCRETGC